MDLQRSRCCQNFVTELTLLRFLLRASPLFLKKTDREKHNMVSEVSLKTGQVRSCMSTGSDTETNNSSDQTDRTTTLCSSVSSLLTTS